MSADENPLDIAPREFRIDDYDALVRLWSDSGLSYKPAGRDRLDRIQEDLRHGNAIFLVAETKGKLVGSILGTHDGRKGWINRLAVAPALRRKGIARMLVTEVEKRLSQLGIEIVACLIEDWNSESMKAFQNLGYTRHPDIVYLTKRKNPEV